MDVGIDRESGHAEGEEQGAVGGLGADALEAAEVVVGGFFVELLQVLEVDLAVIGADLAKDRLDARGLLFREAADSDVTLDFFDWRVRDLVPRTKPASKLAVACGAVGGTGVLREDRFDEHPHAVPPDPRRARAILAAEQVEDCPRFCDSCGFYSVAGLGSEYREGMRTAGLVTSVTMSYHSERSCSDY